MIKRHHKLSYVRKDLSRSSAGRWISQAPADTAEFFITSQAVLASWIAERRSDLVGKDLVRILVLGTIIDTFDHGAWWSLLPALLDRSADWAKITVVVPESMGPTETSGFAPPMSSVEKTVTLVRGDLENLNDLDQGAFDIVFLSLASAEHCASLLSRPTTWKYLDQGSELIVGSENDVETSLYLDVCEIYGLSPVQQMNNRFFDAALEDTDQANSLISARGSKPADLRVATTHAINLTKAIDVIKDLCTERADRVDDYHFWGMRSIIKSSIDSTDEYISLPCSHAVRVSTGCVYRVDQDLIDGFSYQEFAPGFLDEYPEAEGHWTERVRWAVSAWNSGVGEAYFKTIQSRLDCLGGANADRILDGLKQSTSGPLKKALMLLMKTVTGGGKYSPTKEERLLFDAVDRGDEGAVLTYVSMNPALLNSVNQNRYPLLLVLGIGDMPRTMQRIIDLGANPNVNDGGERPILVELARSGKIETVQVLLDSGVDPNCNDPLGWTPLLFALRFKRWEILDLLLDYGADTTQTNSIGMSARTIASGQKSEEELQMEPEILAMESVLGSDVFATLKLAGMGMQPSDIPRELRERILSS